MKRMIFASFILFSILGIVHDPKGSADTSTPQGREPQTSIQVISSERTGQSEEVARAACKSEEARSNEATGQGPQGVVEEKVGSGRVEPSEGQVTEAGESRNQIKEPEMVMEQEWSSWAEPKQNKRQEQKQARPEDSERESMER